MRGICIRKQLAFILLSIILAFLILQQNVSANGIETRSNESVMLSYSAHLQKLGWTASKYNGERVGTVGSSLRMEALKVNVLNIRNYSGHVLYKSHIQTYGWEDNWHKDGELSGTEGQSKRVEAVRIKLTGDLERLYDVYYRVHVQTYGWLEWAKNGESAGSEGYSKRIEAIEMVLVDKGEPAPGKTKYSFIDAHTGVGYVTHVQTYGWQDECTNGQEAGTVGLSKRLESIRIDLKECSYEGDIEYQTHVQTYGWEEKWKRNGEKSGTEGQSKRLEAIRIRLTGELEDNCDIYYRVHTQHYGWLGWAKNGEEAGTAGFSYRMESIQILLLPKNARTFDQTVSYVDKNSVAETSPSWQLSDIQTDLEGAKCNINTSVNLMNIVEGTGDTVICRYSWYNQSTQEKGTIGQAIAGESVTWTPQISGNYVITVTAEDESFRSIQKTINIQVVRDDINKDEVFFTAHRGLSSQAPDNSIPAFELAGQNGFDSIETDVVETLDGVFVIFHDNSLVDVCGINKNISDLTYEQLKDYDTYHIMSGANVGSYSNYDLRIPTVEEFLQVCINYGCIPQLDSKNLNSFESVKRLYDILCKYGVQDSSIVTSFNNLYLQSLREINSNITLTYGVDSTQYLDYNWLQNYNVGVSVQYNNILQNNFGELSERNIAVNVYTVKDINIAKTLVDKGVTSITTDRVLWE